MWWQAAGRCRGGQGRHGRVAKKRSIGERGGRASQHGETKREAPRRTGHNHTEGGRRHREQWSFSFFFFFFFFDVGRVDAGHDPEDARQARTTRSQQRPQRDGSTAVRVRQHRPPGTGLCSTAEARSPHERLGLPHASLLVHWTGMAINHPSKTCRKGARRRGTRTSYQVGRQF